MRITSKMLSLVLSAGLIVAAGGALPSGISTAAVAPASGWTASINGVTFVPSQSSAHANFVTPDYSAGTIALCNAGFGSVSVESWKNAHGHIDLFCGDSTQGYVHIRSGHQADWQAVITKYPIGGSWDDSMSFATGQAIISGPVYNAGNGKLCYTAPWQIKHNGKVVATYHPTIIISGTRNLVITSYPTHLTSEC